MTVDPAGIAATSTATAPARGAAPPPVEPSAVAPLDMAPPQTPPREDRGSRSFGKQALIDTFSRSGARAGIAWVGFLMTLAVFAPFIANSMPVAVQTDRGWSSPLLQTLRPIDVILVIAFATCVTLLVLRKWSFGKS